MDIKQNVEINIETIFNLRININDISENPSEKRKLKKMKYIRKLRENKNVYSSVLFNYRMIIKSICL